MCLLIAKDKKMRCPSEKELYQAFKTNPHGAGFAYVDNGKVIIDKGYMNWDDFIREYKTICKKYNNFKDKCLMVHLRIGTSGGNTPGNTHPYMVTTNIKQMQKLDNKCDLAVAMNGVAYDYLPEGHGYNDTMEFIKSYMTNIQKLDKKFYARRYFREQINGLTNSKWAFLDKNDNIYTCGKFINRNNLLFSNENHVPYDEKIEKYDNYYAKYWSKY